MVSTLPEKEHKAVILLIHSLSEAALLPAKTPAEETFALRNNQRLTPCCANLRA